MFFALDAALPFHCPVANSGVVRSPSSVAAQVFVGIHLVRYSIKHEGDIGHISNDHLSALTVTVFTCIVSNAQITNVETALQAPLAERYVYEMFHADFEMLEVRAMAPIPPAKPPTLPAVPLAAAQATAQPALRAAATVDIAAAPALCAIGTVWCIHRRR